MQKLDKSFRSFAKYGTVCEIVSHEQTRIILGYPTENTPERFQSNGSTMVQAMGVHRFRVDRVLHRALDGLILTCEVTNFYEDGSDIDVKLAGSELFTQMKNNAIEFCRISQQAVT